MRTTSTFQRRTRQTIASHRRRARLAGQQLDYNLEQLRQFILDALRCPCCYCGRLMDARTWSIDHMEPTSRGGSFCLENLAVIHKDCNSVKGALAESEMFDLLALLRTWPVAAQRSVWRRLRLGTVLGARQRRSCSLPRHQEPESA